MQQKEKIVYQIWPRSFLDTNGDGIGDLRGVIRKLDYIKWLGADLIWLSPIYPSPNSDYGYDISDYYSINPEYGTMEDFDELLAEAKKRDIGILMDLVVNHTSREHSWFKKALADKESRYRNYYYFREGKNGGAPNNWMSFFGGSAWTKDEASGEYYLTSFTPDQCDLNWDNPEVRYEVYDMMRFWLDKGIAGFRMDVINTIKKTQGLPDKDPEKKGLQFPGDLISNLPGCHEYLREMNHEVLSRYDCFTVGEGVFTGTKEVADYSKPENHELMMMFHFELASVGCGDLGKYDFRKLYRWSTADMKEIIDRWQTEIQKSGGWVGNYLSNHDQPRQVSRFADDGRYRVAAAKALAILNLTLRGTSFIYQGEECGMTNCALEEDEWRDFEAKNSYMQLQKMFHVPKFIAKKIVRKVTRDNARTPVQWTSGFNAGFTKGAPWMKINDNYKEINIEDDMKRPDSIVNFYKAAIELRKTHPVFTFGQYKAIDRENKRVIAYLREGEGERMLVVVNLSGKKAEVHLPEFTSAECLLWTHATRWLAPTLKLAPYEAFVFKVSSRK